MASTRDYTSLGEFGKNADEVQQPNTPVRVPGDAYRNTEYTTFQQQLGKQFNIVPVSENINQQVYNQTQFTNLINNQGIPGWTSLVTYDKPAVVFASDGKLYFNKIDGNANIDPVGGSNINEDFWGEYHGSEDLDNIYASEVDGSEGARLVGVTKVSTDRSGRPFVITRTGETLQDSLVRNEALLADNMKNIRVVASGNLTATNNGSTFFNEKKSVNIDSANVTVYSKTADIKNGTIDRIGYVTVNFINPVPTPYLYMLDIDQPRFFISSSSNKIFLHQTSFSITEPTATSIKIGALMLTDRQGSNSPAGTWPPIWETEDPDSRIQWGINFTCFAID